MEEGREQDCRRGSNGNGIDDAGPGRQAGEEGGTWRMDGCGGSVKCSHGGVEPSLSPVAAWLLAF